MDREKLWRHFASRTFRKMVLLLSEFLDFWIYGENQLGRRCRAFLAGAFLFCFLKHVPFQKNTYIAVLGYFIFFKLRLFVLIVDGSY